MPHVAPLDRSELPEFEDFFKRYDEIRGFLPNSILTMGRRPEIAKAFMALNQAVIYEGTVPEALKMMVAYMTSMATGCRYCQSHMANLSSVYDVSYEKIQAVWDCSNSVLFTDAEKAVLELARVAAAVPNAAETHHFDAVKQHFNDAEIVEIVGTIALFGYLNRWNDTMATTLEDYPRSVAKRAIGPVGWDAGKHTKETS
ncbi:MAG: carboxymuconolactone decarboxylase family protein [Pseudomonadota bacterium]